MARQADAIVIPGSVESGMRLDESYVWGSKRTLRVYFDPDDDENYVRTNLGDPYTLGTKHPSDPWQIIVDINVKDEPDLRSHPDPTNDGLVREWHADITYGLWTALLASATGNPVDRPPLWRIQCTRITKIADEDTDENPITNTAGDPFKPPVEKDATSMILYVNRNETAPNFPEIFGEWVDHINAADWNGFPARTLKICPVNLPERQFSQVSGSLYYPMEYSFEYNPDTWDKKILNQGYRELDPADSSGATLRPILVEGTQPQEPLLLDEDGHYLPPPITKDDTVYIVFKIYKDLDFSVLKLDNLFANTNAPQGGSGTGGGS